MNDDMAFNKTRAHAVLQGGWGTENYIIPLGAGYIEIAALWDPEAAQSCDWGK